VLEFVAGIVVGVAVVAPVVLVLMRRMTPEKRPRRHTGTGSVDTIPDGRLPTVPVEQLGRLTGGLAHEIKNPLSTMKVNLKLISEDLESLRLSESGRSDLDKEDQRFARASRKISVIRQETDRLEQILEGFLRYVSGAKLQKARTDINELVSDMVDFYTPQASSHSVTIRHMPHNQPMICRVDADMLKQVILNLFINAQQAMSNGGELIVAAQPDNRNALIRITDTGSGIPADKLPRIFEAYYSSRTHGSGLGLAMAKRLVEAHGGAIAVESTLGKGTSFIVRLPTES